MVKFIKRLLIAACCFGAGYLVLSNIPFVQGFDANISGWAWAVFFASVVGMAFVQGFGTGVLKSVMESTNIKSNSVIDKYVDEVFDWVSLAVAFVVTVWLMPDSASVSSVPVLFFLASFVGCLAGTYELISDRFVK
ncbi:MAG: hypothetical protein JSS83_25890 [Cyanobacteria bacterium SZAS LIN-3]|nr:hypothetical protein [Cyanobacteria bacterium SZAS LIN-3]MBS2011196.1 hypothetical protein [Cyanobacteria bacterium SZAS TMP-1]